MGLLGGVGLVIIMCISMMTAHPVKVSAEELYEFDLDDFYVSDEFLLNGTAGIQNSAGCESEADSVDSDSVDVITDTDSAVSNRFDAAVGSYTIPKMVTSPEGVAMVERWEGCRLTAYKALASEKYYTIGYGHYGADVTANMTITQAQAEALLKQDLNKFESHINNFAQTNKILFAQNEFDALVSLVYNIGVGNFSDSTIRRYILEGFDNHTDADYTYAISMWHYSGGVSIQGLVNRRAAESALFVRYGVKRPEVKSIALNLKGRIAVEVFIDIPAGITGASGAYAVCQGVESTNTKLSSMTHDGTLYCVSSTCAAKDMKEYMTVVLYDASGVKLPLKGSNTADGHSYRTSVNEYISMASSSGNDNLKNVTVAMSEYGKCAEAYFAGKTYAGTGSINSVTSSDFAPYTCTIDGTATGILYAGTSLILKSDTKIRHYFSLKDGYNIQHFTFGLDSGTANASGNGSMTATMSVSEHDGLYYLEISNISPVDYDKLFSVSVKNKSNGTQMNIQYSVFAYGNQVHNLDAETGLKQLLGAMYRYNQAAEAYF